MANEREANTLQTRDRSLLWSVLALLVFVVIAVAGYNYSAARHDTIIATAPLDSECLINLTPCSNKLPEGGSVTLNIEPRPLVATTPMRVSVQTNGLPANSIEINFRGESMNMGLNQYRLLDQGTGLFTAQVTLPVCVRNSMFWIAEVMVSTPEGTMVFPFRLETIHP